MLVSQCNKRALTQTRRILDQFAERKGERTWQTAITQEGLNTLRKLLKKSARRNTAVACHWIKSNHRTELIWIVGNQNRFNEQGTVPTNTTARDVLKNQDEHNWHTGEVIALLAAIAALFHDFGKANVLFQAKLLPGTARSSEPYRHEWVSLRLFQAFVVGKTDAQWLSALANVSGKDEAALLQNLASLQDHPQGDAGNPFKELPPFAKAVAWLVLTHHKLPVAYHKPQANLRFIHQFVIKNLRADWNSPQLNQYVEQDSDASADDLIKVWQFPRGTPLRSKTWCQRAQRVAQRALGSSQDLERPWLEDTFSMHMARLGLMLADHYFSSIPGFARYRDADYGAFANTDRKSGQLKQQLDEHLVGVYQNALRLMRVLPAFTRSLPAIGRHSEFRKRSKGQRFAWQNRAYELAYTLKNTSKEQGFFGVNLASTGCGKTFANARIMYGLADEKQGCRFSVALGLRTLTLQTGDAFSAKLKLEEDDLAVMIGSQAVRRLYELQGQDAAEAVPGSESASALLEENSYVRYEGALGDGPLNRWLSESPKLNRLVSAPILVSTIDHLMPATEGIRGGRQIAPMLRLLTSDLVLDEPDEFGLDDIPALCRLVHWAGMLGSRVLLSSATLSPALVQGLFAAYRSGREAFNRARSHSTKATTICCAWFDEWSASAITATDEQHFLSAHQDFIATRVSKLAQQSPLRRARIVQVEVKEKQKPAIIAGMADAIFNNLRQLHADHGTMHRESGVRLSLGLVRIANINPLVALAKDLLSRTPPPDTAIHFCVYHSQYPLIVRSRIERCLDATLNRKDGNAIWSIPEIQAAIARHPAKQHIFVVLASPVAEVGRDHDYDWAIAEPSSMRSIIQLAGRIQRHRQQPCDQPNLVLLHSNLNGLMDAEVAFTRPGFEHKDRPLASHNLAEVLLPEQYQQVMSTPCIEQNQPLHWQTNLVDLEHYEVGQRFCAEDPGLPYAHQWLKPQATLTGELQQLTRFRKSAPSDDYYLWLEDEDSDDRLYKWHLNGEAKPCDEIKKEPLAQASAERLWIKVDYCQAMQGLAEKLDDDVATLSQTFGAVSLRQNSNNQPWLYTPELGFYRAPS